MKGNVQGMGVAIVWAINKKNRTLVTLKTWTLNCILKLDARLNTWSGGFEKHSPSHGTYISFYFPASLIIWQARITFQFSVSLNSLTDHRLWSVSYFKLASAVNLVSSQLEFLPELYPQALQIANGNFAILCHLANQIYCQCSVLKKSNDSRSSSE